MSEQQNPIEMPPRTKAAFLRGEEKSLVGALAEMTYECKEVEIALTDWREVAEEAGERIKDLLKGDDGQAHSEAERFLEKLEAMKGAEPK